MALAAGGMRQQTCCHGFDDPASRDPHSQPRPSSATGLGGSRVSSRDSRRIWPISSLSRLATSRSRATRATTARVRRTRSLGRLYIRVNEYCLASWSSLPCGHAGPWSLVFGQDGLEDSKGVRANHVLEGGSCGLPRRTPGPAPAQKKHLKTQSQRDLTQTNGRTQHTTHKRQGPARGATE